MKTDRKLAAVVPVLVGLLLAPSAGARSIEDSSVVSEESPISDAIDVGAENHQIRPEVSWGPDAGFAVWLDSRLYQPRIYGAPLENGASSKVVGYDISGETEAPRDPVVGSTGGRFLALWIASGAGGRELHGTTLNGNGRILRRNFMVSEVASGSGLAVAGGEDGFLATFTNLAGDLTALRIDTEGRPVGEAMQVYNEGSHGHLEVAWGAGTFLVSFIACDPCEFGARSARVTWEEGVLDRDGLPLTRSAADDARISSAWDGSRFVVVWTQSGAVYGAPVDPEERPGTSESFLISGSVAMSPDISWTGTAFLVAWVESQRSLVTTLLSDELEVANPVPTPVSERISPETRPVLTSSNTDHLIAWDGPGGEFFDIFRAGLTPIGAPATEVEVLVHSAFGQIRPSISAGAGSHLALWQDYRAHSGPIVYGGRVGPNGEVLDGTGFQISRQNGIRPVAGWNGRTWLVVWLQRQNGGHVLVGSRVGPDGSVLDPVPVPLTPLGSRKRDVEVASDGNGYVVIWREAVGRSIRTIYVSADGVSGALPVEIDDQASDPALVWSGDRYIAVWERNREIRGAFLDDRGELLDRPRRVTRSEAYDFDPSVSVADGHALVTWARCDRIKRYCERSSVFALGFESSFEGRVVRLTGPTAFYDDPLAIWDGGRYAIVWSGCTDRYVCTSPSAHLRYMTSTGAPASEVSTIARAQVSGAPSFRVASLGDGSFTVVYRRLSGIEEIAGVPRGYLRTVRRT
jgi:hypothetical protein